MVCVVYTGRVKAAFKLAGNASAPLPGSRSANGYPLARTNLAHKKSGLVTGGAANR